MIFTRFMFKLPATRYFINCFSKQFKCYMKMIEPKCYRMERTKPPSTRMEAPFVAEASGLT